LQHQKEGKKLVGCLPLRMCSESAEEAKFATLQEYVPESKEEQSVGTVDWLFIFALNRPIYQW
jgi:hypothetical protein